MPSTEQSFLIAINIRGERTTRTNKTIETHDSTETHKMIETHAENTVCAKKIHDTNAAHSKRTKHTACCERCKLQKFLKRIGSRVMEVDEIWHNRKLNFLVYS